MTITGNLEIAAPSSSSQPSSWDVFFISFCGKDTRANFISHLYKALFEAGFVTFRDDPALEKGEEISSGLLGAIRGSKMFFVVISKNYARSRWCLDELVEILRCKSKNIKVVPVFYYVDPSDLRHHKGCFGEALDYHRKHYSTDMIDNWKSALAQIAELSGYHLKKHANENESETIQQIVENEARQVSTKLLHLEKDLFGIDHAVEEIYQKLRMESNNVRAIGICGMGGIGKTTTAKAFYNKYSNIFDISCFIDKVKQYSQGGSPLLPLLNQVLTGILRKKEYKVTDVQSGIRQLKQILCFKKALFVLDDLDQVSYSEFLLTLRNLFSAGSRIIVTTRDVKMLNQLRIDIAEVDIYMVKKLGEIDSLELFSYHAFRTPTPPANLRVFSESFVTYAGGLPLALKVLGSSLCGTHDVLFWKAKLEKIKQFPEDEILEILQLSYDELGDMEKKIFLDIAVFFVGKYEIDAVEIFQSCHFFPEVGITILVERCLVAIDENSKFQMHDLIQDMGRELGKSTHLAWRGSALRDLQNRESNDHCQGTEKIEVLILDLTLSTEKLISFKIFEKLPKLRLLEISNVHGISGHFRNSFHELRSIYWSYCKWTRLPSSFQPQKLVSLHMPYSNFRKLWNGVLPFKRLKTLILNYSVNLKTTPDFGNSKLVQRLGFCGCESLLKVHPSIRELTGLYTLDLRECTRLKVLHEQVGQLTILGHLYLHMERPPEPMKQWTNMGYLYLGHCSNLRRLPKQLGVMKGLKLFDASYTAIEELPDSITQLKGLVNLELSSCKKLTKLPDEIGNMEGLRTFSAGDSAIEQLPESFVCLINLERLDLRYCKHLRILPNSIWQLKLLKVLNLKWCSKLEQLPEHLGKMQSLEELHASNTAIEKVPDSIALLSRLQILGLSNCERLKYVPSSVWYLTSLTCLYLLHPDIYRIYMPNRVVNTNLVTLSLNCDIRLWLPVILRFSSLKMLILCDEGESISAPIPFSLSKLDKLKFLELYDWTSFGSSFLELPSSLTRLSLCYHETLVHLPDLSSLKHLKKLDILGYSRLVSLPPLPPHLQSLTVHNCYSLQDLSEMSMLTELAEINTGSSLQVRRLFHSSSIVDVPVIPKWFSYKSRGCTVCFSIPPLLGDAFLGLALWVLFTSKNNNRFNIRANVTNNTNGTSFHCWFPVFCSRGAHARSLVKCISGEEISITTGDRIEISFQRQLYSFDGDVEVPCEEVKVDMCAAHVLQKTTFTPDFPSVLSNLMTSFTYRWELIYFVFAEYWELSSSFWLDPCILWILLLHLCVLFLFFYARTY